MLHPRPPVSKGSLNCNTPFPISESILFLCGKVQLKRWGEGGGTELILKAWYVFFTYSHFVLIVWCPFLIMSSVKELTASLLFYFFAFRPTAFKLFTSISFLHTGIRLLFLTTTYISYSLATSLLIVFQCRRLPANGVCTHQVFPFSGCVLTLLIPCPAYI